MNEKIVHIGEIPQQIDNSPTFEITSNNVGYYTHGFFKYPCKFIPQIPRWAIQKYSLPNDYVLDPFAGSGTTLVEAVLLGRIGLGIDFDKLSQLLCKVKTTNFTQTHIETITRNIPTILSNETFDNFFPDIHNINHWFSKENFDDLKKLRNGIEKFKKNEVIYNFFLVAFASTVRKCSFADDTSPKPYVSSRIKKNPIPAKVAFEKTVMTYIKNIKSRPEGKMGEARIIAEDAREIKDSKYFGKVSLAITSPPYINAFDYVRSLRLENAWLGFYGDSNIIDVKKRQVGTENIPISEYSKKIVKTSSNKFNILLEKIEKIDKKRAHIIYKFFEDMGKNLSEVHKLLKKDGHYVIVVGNSKIRGIDVSTHELLIEIAEASGYELDSLFSYVIKNRYLRIPRSGRGGLIKKDWIIDLRKK